MESFRKRFLRYINVQEAADYQVRLLHRPKDFTRHPLKEQGQGYTTISIEALVAESHVNKDKERKDAYIAKVNTGVMNVYVIRVLK